MNPLDLNRYYEVVELSTKDAHYSSRELYLGAIAQPTRLGDEHVPGYRNLEVVFIRKITPHLSDGTCFFAVALRPLTKKEQEKIDESRQSTP